MESAAEPWFEDARVKTCATILQRCTDASERASHLVRFVRVKRPLSEIIACRTNEPAARFMAFDSLRDRILNVRDFFEDESIRVIVKAQSELWAEGQRASGVLKEAPLIVDADGNEDQVENEGTLESAHRVQATIALSEYAAGKWGRYLRAPGLYFEIMREFSGQFVPLGEIVNVRFGVKSGCDDFFMPHDITREALNDFIADREFKRQFGVARELVESGAVKIVRAGDGSKHPIEAEYLKPEVHTLRDFQRVEMRADDCNRRILLVGQPLSGLGMQHVARYLRYGETHTFESGKSKPVPVPMRSTCTGRDPWYDLTKLAKPGIAFWSMAHHYRHVIPFNPESLICNHRMFDVLLRDNIDARVLVGILNSTVVALWKTFYGRFTGTEGSLDTEVIDVRVLEVPDPQRASLEVAERIRVAFEQLCKRPIGRLVEEQLMECHSPERAAAISAGPIVLPEELRQSDRRELDDAVFELLGVSDLARRQDLIQRLYLATAAHFREIRMVEIQKMEQRSKSKSRRYTVEEIATDAWDAVYFRDEPSLAEWLDTWAPPKLSITIPPEGTPRLVDERSMFDKEIVYFGTGRYAERVVCSTRAQAELVARLAKLGFRGALNLPERSDRCLEAMAELESRLDTAQREFETIASERVADEKKRAEIVALMMRWRIHGRRSVVSQGSESKAAAIEEPKVV